MAQFQALDSSVEVNGQTVLSVVEGMGSFKYKALKILEENGIADPQPGNWYSQQSWLDAFRAISDSIGGATLSQIGKQIPENADWPPDVDSAEKALASIDMAYHMNHRNGEIGRYNFETTGERSGIMTCNNPYPCDFDRGLVEAAAKKFAPEGAIVKVRHDDSKPCRNHGTDSCTYIIDW